jgi:hypothetical protein
LSVVGTQISASNLIADFDPNQAGEVIDVEYMPWIRGFGDLNIQYLTLAGTPFARVSAADGSHSLTINLRGITAGSLHDDDFVFTTPLGLFFGGAGNDTVTGDAGGNTLDGGAGADSMTGRTGDDTYIVDNAGDTVNELPGGGFDTAKAGGSRISSSPAPGQSTAPATPKPTASPAIPRTTCSMAGAAPM